MTSKALGVAMIQHILSFEIVEQTMCGVLLKSNILDLNEAIQLGRMVQDLTIQDIKKLLKKESKKIVILQAASVGKDLDLSQFNTLGDVTTVSYTHLLNLPVKMKTRIIFGCNEESGSSCVKRCV